MIFLLVGAEPAAGADRPDLADPRLHRRHPLRLARLQHRPLGLADPAPDGLPDDARHDRHATPRRSSSSASGRTSSSGSASSRRSTRTASGGIVVTRYFAGFIWSTLTILAGSLTYLYVALQAVAGRLTLGDLTLYTQAASSVQASVQGMLGGLRLDVRAQPLPEQPVRAAGDAVRHRGATDADDRGGRGRRAGRGRAARADFGEVAFEHVTFAYPGSGREALHDAQLHGSRRARRWRSSAATAPARRP